ncbi:MAG TPA: M20 family peptidase [Gemmatimonadales bacterium]|nr:M20 family peptidase [Gemmatimonadales bacterium]
MSKRAFLVLFAAVLILGAIVLERTFTFGSRQPAVPTAAAMPLDTAALATRLAGALRFRTVSYQDSSRFEPREFDGLQRYLRESFPRAHAALKLEKVNGYGLLYEWTGSDTRLAPVMLLAHQDVVPVEPGTEGKWTEPPFAGRVAGGYIWGRGALDDKGSLVAILEAVEHLLEAGAKPRRTVYLAFGYDEEVGGRRGAAQIAAALASRKVHPDFVLDEGGAVATGLIAGIGAPVALVGIAEKGYLTVELVAHAEGGHSSMPPEQTAVGMLAAALTRLEREQMPRAIRGPTAAMFDYLGPEMSFGPRLVLANRWLFGGMLAARFGATPQGNALVRTTTAPTVIQAGVKENVLPSTAQALVNFRILPGDSAAGVVEHVRAVVHDAAIDVRALETNVTNPSAVSDVDAEPFQLLARTIRQVIPGAVVTPWLVVGGTDSRHYGRLTPNVLRFVGATIGKDDLRRVHGIDERIGLQAYADAVRVYVQLLRNAAL